MTYQCSYCSVDPLKYIFNFNKYQIIQFQLKLHAIIPPTPTPTNENIVYHRPSYIIALAAALPHITFQWRTETERCLCLSVHHLLVRHTLYYSCLLFLSRIFLVVVVLSNLQTPLLYPHLDFWQGTSESTKQAGKWYLVNLHVKMVLGLGGTTLLDPFGGPRAFLRAHS